VDVTILRGVDGVVDSGIEECQGSHPGYSISMSSCCCSFLVLFFLLASQYSARWALLPLQGCSLLCTAPTIVGNQGESFKTVWNSDVPEVFSLLRNLSRLPS
jgi:hypothetical protein